ncbi:unnamed protein product [Hermetia illucens]|uniref:Major facilitator superfamily (MFS) profile domain-containing protein n=2 Tax=Hermetia illucens TaxID=343691 RepID=A0A7R8Z087_HERIL|nr:solute carrier family 22 member 5-like isoform X2 [Hermetia illucens]CAD7092119.1 unnamed protein product [Hermetia illucens]
MTTSFVLLMEIIGINRRAIMSVLFQLPFNVGHLILPAYGYFLRQWRWFQFAISFTSIIMLPYWCLLPESPRWLLLRGRIAEAAEILKKGAQMNGLPDENIEADLIKESKKKKSSNAKPVAKGTIIDLFRTPPLALETVIVCFVWFSFGLYFYGCAQYMGHISGNIFGNVAFGAACTIPATLISIPALQYCGRKLYLIISNSISGIAMLIIACISPDNEVPVIVLSSIGMLGMAATLCNVYLYTGELYPTVVRNIAVGIAAMTARIGSMIAPFVVGLKKTEHYLPPIIFAAATLIGAVMVIWLPETRNRPLGETIDDSKQLLASTDKFKFSNVSSNLNKV